MRMMRLLLSSTLLLTLAATAETVDAGRVPQTARELWASRWTCRW